MLEITDHYAVFSDGPGFMMGYLLRAGRDVGLLHISCAQHRQRPGHDEHEVGVTADI